MKKTLVMLLVGCALFGAFTVRAELISEDAISIPRLKAILGAEYGTKVDDDGDIVITNGNNKAFVSIRPKVKLIRIFSIWSKPNDASISDMIRVANKFNYEKVAVRVAVNPENGTSVCDLYVNYKNGITREAFLDMVDWIFVLSKTWNEFQAQNR